MKPVKAYYFSNKDKRLRHGDGRKIRKGTTHTYKGVPRLCESGLHGSTRPIDALKHAPGPIIWRVELSGEMDVGEDKISAQSRKYLEWVDGTDLLRKFARLCALDVVNQIKPWTTEKDYSLIVNWLKTDDEQLRDAARNAAWAARAAAMDAGYAATAAGYAATAAAWAAARNATCDATCDAARNAARDAAWAATAAAWAAARNATCDAARDAACWAATDATTAATAKQNRRLKRMIDNAMRAK